MIDRISSNAGPTGTEPLRGKRTEAVDHNPPPASDAKAVPATPPRRLHASLDTAAGVRAELQSHGLGLHFGIEGDESPRLAVQVRGPEGAVAREIGPS